MFQFHSGSIQTLGGRKFVAVAISFNSTLVRFKPVATNFGAIVLYLFQFHSGSIQTFLMLCVRAKNKRVSIPLWFDSNFCAEQAHPAWHNVSIPLWFDSNLTKQLVDAGKILFQFHSGSIQTNVLHITY